MHEQSDDGLPERVPVSENIRCKHADEKYEDYRSDPRKPEEEPMFSCFHYLDNLVKTTNATPAIITVTNWNIPIALMNIAGKTQNLTRTKATIKSNDAFKTPPTRIDSR